MLETKLQKNLDLRLKEAGLISEAQIQIIKQDRVKYQDLELEEVLTLRGWLRPETINFFSNQIIKLIQHSRKLPLLKCLKRAGLLTETEINLILKNQKETGQELDQLLISSGIIKKSTLQFFNKYLIEKKNQDLEKIGFQSSSKSRAVHSLAINNNLEVSKVDFSARDGDSECALSRESLLLSLRLTKAGLVSEEQMEMAIAYLNKYRDLSLERVIFLRGWLSQETLEFFGKGLPKLIERGEKIPLVKILELASILNGEQINKLVKYQEERGKKVSSSLIEMGYIKESTLNFFQNYAIE